MATLRILSTNAVRGVLSELVPSFERANGHEVDVAWLTTNQTMARLREGERGDVVIGTAEGVSQLEREGAVVPRTRADIGSTAVGVAVRRGAPRPDVSSVEAFKRTLLDAKSVAWTTMGASGVHFEAVLDKLGIADRVKSKSKAIVIPGGLIGELLARDEAALGIQMVSEIMAVPGAELVGLFPASLQKKTVFCAALLAATEDADAARAFIAHLSAPQSARLLKERGFDAP